jgi:hypothetical protein
MLSSAHQYDLVHVYFGNDPAAWRFCPEILQLLLEFAGLIGRGRHCSYFWIYT